MVKRNKDKTYYLVTTKFNDSNLYYLTESLENQSPLVVNDLFGGGEIQDIFWDLNSDRFLYIRFITDNNREVFYKHDPWESDPVEVNKEVFEKAKMFVPRKQKVVFDDAEEFLRLGPVAAFTDGRNTRYYKTPFNARFDNLLGSVYLVKSGKTLFLYDSVSAIQLPVIEIQGDSEIEYFL